MEDATTSFLAQASTALSKKYDESDAFGLLTANKLRSMSEEQRQMAECLLLQVLNKGVRGDITKNTCVSEYPTPAPPPTPTPPPPPQTAHWHYPGHDVPTSSWSHDYRYTNL